MTRIDRFAFFKEKEINFCMTKTFYIFPPIWRVFSLTITNDFQNSKNVHPSMIENKAQILFQCGAHGQSIVQQTNSLLFIPSMVCYWYPKGHSTVHGTTDQQPGYSKCKDDWFVNLRDKNCVLQPLGPAFRIKLSYRLMSPLARLII